MSYNPFSLSGKTILVTGASSGIGQATAVECSKMGAKVVITGRNAERLQQTMDQLEGEGHQQIIAELTNAEDLQRLVDETPALNGLVLCAGRGFTLPFLFCDLEKYQEVFSVNFFSPIQLLRLIVKKKKLGGGGSVVVVSSTGGNQRHTNGNSVYGATKAAISSTMRFCARELAPKKIRINAVNPSMVKTPLVEKFQNNLTQEQIDADVKRFPLGRYGEPVDIAHGIIYLLSDAASWVTGHSLVIDGGVTI